MLGWFGVCPWVSIPGLPTVHHTSADKKLDQALDCVGKLLRSRPYIQIDPSHHDVPTIVMTYLPLTSHFVDGLGLFLHVSPRLPGYTTIMVDNNGTASSVARMRRLMRSLRDSGNYTDMIISAEGCDMRVHKAIVCSQSTYFAAALNNGFMETHTSRIDLPEDYDTIRSLVDFCYLQDSGPCLYLSNSIDQQIRLYVAADKYGVHSLKERTHAWIICWLRAQRWPIIFPDKVRDVWRAIPPDEKVLRDLVIEVIERNLSIFLKEEPRLRFLTGIPEVPVSILRHVNDGTAHINSNNACVIL